MGFSWKKSQKRELLKLKERKKIQEHNGENVLAKDTQRRIEGLLKEIG